MLPDLFIYLFILEGSGRNVLYLITVGAVVTQLLIFFFFNVMMRLKNKPEADCFCWPAAEPRLVGLVNQTTVSTALLSQAALLGRLWLCHCLVA